MLDGSRLDAVKGSRHFIDAIADENPAAARYVLSLENGVLLKLVKTPFDNQSPHEAQLFAAEDT